MNGSNERAERLLSKTGVWVWVQVSARMVLKAGKPDFIICRQKPLTNEESEEYLRQRQLQLPFNFATGEALLYESFPSLMIHRDTTGRHQNSVLPGNLIMRCKYSSSHSQKLIDLYRQKALERECVSDSRDLFALRNLAHPPNSCSVPGHFSIPFHHNHSSSIEKTGMVLSDPSKNNHLSLSVPGLPFSVKHPACGSPRRPAAIATPAARRPINPAEIPLCSE
ncbi:uncharacterized protein LOC131548272 [Onychostoma macrolepis]|uniref:uncharacterized protein LOC131548272 n=1 Tax=Onychostoma macrolepis TaxID=369639 RepID=UPI00272A51BD|nr:uncharacterized protein LOC131548272 [Onychostoma macrolepis]